MQPIRSTTNIQLKPHTLKNAEKLTAWFNDEEIAFFSDDEAPLEENVSITETKEILIRWINTPENGSIIHYAIHRIEDDAFIGFLMIAHIDRYNHRCDIGIVIGEKKEWGKGYAQEALSAAIDHCFEHLNMNRIGAEIYAFNHRSILLFSTLGFKHEGTKRNYVFKNGQYEDELMYSLLRSEWELITD